MTGITATALFQSSSVVTLMALSLIGAQIMTLESGIAVIFGSNIGTTITAWIVGLVGFKMDIKLLSYLFIGIGGLGSAFDIMKYRFDNPYWYVLIGFGLTALIQSSSASIAIIQSALFAKIIGFDAAAAFVVGSNVGTTVTAILGAIGGIPIKNEQHLHICFLILQRVL